MKVSDVPAIRFSDALERGGITARKGPDADVTAVTYDSRRARPGTVFVAMRGEAFDGNRFLVQALACGAAAVVTDSPSTFAAANETTPIALCEHGRKALAAIAANVYGHPERKIALNGITGTNGKSTTAFLLESMLKAAQRRCVLIGTIEYHVADRILPAPHTTPESSDLIELLRDGLAENATEAIMEVSSHALDQARVWGLHFRTAIFTNLTPDHLDYHHTMENYFEAKRKLFFAHGGVPPNTAVVCADDPHGLRLARELERESTRVVTYGIEHGDVRAENIRMTAQGSSFRFVSPFGSVEMHTHLAGRVNVLNTLAAACAAISRDASLQEILAGAENLKRVPGRFEQVFAGPGPHAQPPFTVIVDYAHTPDALRNLIALAREFVAGTAGRVLTVFGCGGDRDRSKRPVMGRIAADGSDVVVLTSDNPRSEDPMAILQEIEHGLPSGANYKVEPDRAKAIAFAIHSARAGDIVLIAGKGHEKTQTIGQKILHFDDVEVAREVLAQLVSATTEHSA